LVQFIDAFPDSRKNQDLMDRFVQSSGKYSNMLPMRERIMHRYVNIFNENLNAKLEYAWINIQLDRLQVARTVLKNIVSTLGTEVAEEKEGQLALALLGYIQYKLDGRLLGLSLLNKQFQKNRWDTNDIFLHRLAFLKVKVKLEQEKYKSAFYLLKILNDYRDVMKSKDGELYASINAAIRKAYWHYMGSTKGFDLFFTDYSDEDGVDRHPYHMHLESVEGVEIMTGLRYEPLTLLYCDDLEAEDMDRRLGLLKKIKEEFGESVQVKIVYQGWDNVGLNEQYIDEISLLDIDLVRPVIPELTRGMIYFLKDGKIVSWIKMGEEGFISNLLTELNRLSPSKERL
jgi:hypothetical protein